MAHFCWSEEGQIGYLALASTSARHFVPATITLLPASEGPFILIEGGGETMLLPATQTQERRSVPAGLPGWTLEQGYAVYTATYEDRVIWLELLYASEKKFRSQDSWMMALERHRAEQLKAQLGMADNPFDVLCEILQGLAPVTFMRGIPQRHFNKLWGNAQTRDPYIEDFLISCKLYRYYRSSRAWDSQRALEGLILKALREAATHIRLERARTWLAAHPPQVAQ